MLFHGFDDNVDGGGINLTHLTQAVDCSLKARKEQDRCGSNATTSRSLLHGSVKSTDAKENDDGVDKWVDGCFDGCVDDCFNGYVDGRIDCYVDDCAECGDNHLIVI
eukprot:12136989-Ditylum_brightwellii.AAC.1